MSGWYWRVIGVKAAFVFTCFVLHYRFANGDNVQKLPFCNPNDDAANSDLVLVSTLDGKLTAFSTQNGNKAWLVETQPLLSSNLHHVELTAGGKWVRLVPSLRGTLYSLSGDTIEPLPFDSDQLLSSSFKYSDDLVVAGARETLWLGVDAGTGAVIYECGSAGCSSEQQTAGAGRDVIVLRRHSSTVRALDPRTGSEKWNFSVAEHQVALSRRECAGAGGGPAGSPAVSVSVALPEGVVGVRRAGERAPLWQHKLEAPIAGMWRLHGGYLQHMDVLFEATQSLLDGALTAPPSLYIGSHDRQLYIQEGTLYAQKLETAMTARPLPWKLVTSRTAEETALAAPAPPQNHPPDNTLSLITLYGNTQFIGNHGFFLYLQETCDQSLPFSDSVFDDDPRDSDNLSDDGERYPDDHHHIHVHVYSLWFWWKEVLLIAVSSALLMNLMIWPRLFATKMPPSTPLPTNQEYIVVERHYDHPVPVPTSEYSGRYENDFTPLRRLGRGGFGVVFEARNNIDHCSYAVKRITLPRREAKRERVLREVRVLAKLEHENIVRYFNAWVEEPPPMWQEKRDALLMKELDEAWSPVSEDRSVSTKHTTAAASAPKRQKLDSVLLNMHKPIDDCIDALEFSKRTRSQSCNESFSIVFDANASKQSSSSKTSTPQKSTPGTSPNMLSKRNIASGDDDSFVVFDETRGQAEPGQSLLHGTPDITHDKTDSCKKRKKGHTRHWSLDMCVRGGGRGAGSKMYLYIQMQLCRPDSLHDWLRHNRTWDSRGENVKSLFRQIVSAVEYVHLAGLIHRDLKPSNILFAPDGKVKVGDFGLVTAMTESHEAVNSPLRPKHHMHTYQVGTTLYMSPEQLLGKPYGFKVDIYSLGLILFELLHPFGTEAERVACLRNVRNGHYPQQFVSKHPHETEVLKLMLSEEASRRPSATGVRARAPLYESTDERWHFSLPNKAQ